MGGIAVLSFPEPLSCFPLQMCDDTPTSPWLHCPCSSAETGKEEGLKHRRTPQLGHRISSKEWFCFWPRAEAQMSTPLHILPSSLYAKKRFAWLPIIIALILDMKSCKYWRAKGDEMHEALEWGHLCLRTSQYKILTGKRQGFQKTEYFASFWHIIF